MAFVDASGQVVKTAPRFRTRNPCAIAHQVAWSVVDFLWVFIVSAFASSSKMPAARGGAYAPPKRPSGAPKKPAEGAPRPSSGGGVGGNVRGVSDYGPQPSGPACGPGGG